MTEVYYRCEGFDSLFDEEIKPYYSEFVVIKRTRCGVWLSHAISGTWKKFMYETYAYTEIYGPWGDEKLSTEKKRYCFARPTKELAFKDFKTRIDWKIYDAKMNLDRWETEKRLLRSYESFRAYFMGPFLPAPDQVDRTIYERKMREGVLKEAHNDPTYLPPKPQHFVFED